MTNIRVETKHEARGVTGDFCECMLARAIREATGAQDVSVTNAHCVVDGQVFRLPDNARMMRMQFDAGQAVTFRDFVLPI